MLATGCNWYHSKTVAGVSHFVVRQLISLHAHSSQQQSRRQFVEVPDCKERQSTWCAASGNQPPPHHHWINMHGEDHICGNTATGTGDKALWDDATTGPRSNGINKIQNHFKLSSNILGWVQSMSVSVASDTYFVHMKVICAFFQQSSPMTACARLKNGVVDISTQKKGRE